MCPASSALRLTFLAVHPTREQGRASDHHHAVLLHQPIHLCLFRQALLHAHLIRLQSFLLTLCLRLLPLLHLDPAVLPTPISPPLNAFARLPCLLLSVPLLTLLPGSLLQGPLKLQPGRRQHLSITLLTWRPRPSLRLHCHAWRARCSVSSSRKWCEEKCGAGRRGRTGSRALVRGGVWAHTCFAGHTSARGCEEGGAWHNGAGGI